MTLPMISPNFCRSAISVENSCVASSPVCARRYFKTNAVTPFAAKYLATTPPSLVMERAIKLPPGHITIAVPFFCSGAGLKIVSVGFVTLVTTSVFQVFENYSFSG